MARRPFSKPVRAHEERNGLPGDDQGLSKLSPEARGRQQRKSRTPRGEIKLKSWEIKADFLEINLGNQPNPPAPPTFTTYDVIFEGNHGEVKEKSRNLVRQNCSLPTPQPEAAMLPGPRVEIRPPPPVPPFLLAQSVSPKDIAGSDVTSWKLYDANMRLSRIIS